jgi:hypothetical protein
VTGLPALAFRQQLMPPRVMVPRLWCACILPQVAACACDGGESSEPSMMLKTLRDQRD